MPRTRRRLPTAEEYQDYQRHRERMAQKSRIASEAARDIGEIPPVAQPARRDASKRDFRLFCETYLSATFRLRWSDDHLRVIARIQQAVLHGGLFALAMPRGAGKTSLAEAACLWAMLYGHHEFICLIGATEMHALEMLETLKIELEKNDVIAEDFPEVCYPIRCLEGIHHRCAGQLYRGERTHILWTAGEIVLPTIRLPDDDNWREYIRPDGYSAASGAIVKVTGITGRIRGMKFKRPDGASVRPSLVVIDDPQTDESARSASQCYTRERVIAGAVLGLAGPGRKISGVMPCTVIRRGDVADNILDRQKHPEWNGERAKMVYAWPKNEDLWKRYAEIRADSLRTHGDIRDATEFYRQNREKMDEGCKVAWNERFNPDEISAIQHAMNLRLQDEAAFFAEYQNEPMENLASEDEEIISAEEIAQKCSGYDRGIVPVSVSHITAFVDVQGKLLYWMVCGWSDGFSGYIIDYGAYPEQRQRYFLLRDARPTLQDVAKGAGMEGAIYAGLEAVAQKIIGREWRREDGAAMRVCLCLIDANWGASTDTVYKFCRQSQYASLLMPAHGRFVGAASRPFSEYTRKPGERVGLNWRVPLAIGRHAVRHVLFDCNAWKSFVHSRLATAIGDRGSIALPGRDPTANRMLADHLAAEYRIRTEGRGRIVEEWRLKPESGGENHWLDCLVGCAVAASMQGVSLFETSEAQKSKAGGKIKLSSLQRARRK